MSEITQDDLRDVRDTILEEMRLSRKETTDRLDRLNGTVGEHAKQIAVLQDRGTRDTGARWTAGLVGLAGFADWLARVLGTR